MTKTLIRLGQLHFLLHFMDDSLKSLRCINFEKYEGNNNYVTKKLPKGSRQCEQVNDH